MLALRTPRLHLRPLERADVPKVYAMSLEAGIRRFLPDQVYRDETHAEQVVGRLAFVDEVPDPRVRPCVLGVEHDGELVGHVGLSPWRGSVEIGYAVEQRLHGQGVASEAVNATAAWALDTLGVPEVLGIVDVDNLASRRVLENAGFVRDDVASSTSTKLVYRRVR